MRSSFLLTGLTATLAALLLGGPTPSLATPQSTLNNARMHKLRHDSVDQLALTEVELDRRAFYFANTKIRGVNIGGWLVAEPFITPSLFSATGDNRVIDEWTFGKYVPDARARLQRHWATWVTQSTFREIAAVGYLNLVRIPIGHWGVESSFPEPYVKGNQLEYLTKAVGWASKYGLKVMIDLHGAPGSQNGFDNSGQYIPAGRPLGWHHNATNVARTKAAVVKLAKLFGTAQYRDTVVAIQPLNEPAGFRDAAILPTYDAFLKNTYQAIRRDTGPNGQPNNALTYAISNAFMEGNYWNGRFQPPTYTNLVLDRHIYSMFGQGQNMWKRAQRLSWYCSLRPSLSSSHKNIKTIVGEWTVSPYDCAKWLNGRGKGSRFEGTFNNEPRRGSCYNLTADASRFSPAYKSLLKAMFETQTKVYEQYSGGWIMWAWDMEAAPEWSFREGLKGGWIPKGSLGAWSDSYC
ncbi:hypothetical protein V8E36_000877 [Tilletia maclaganii]